MSYPGDFALSQPDKPAVVMAGSGVAINYRDLHRRSNSLALALHRAGLRLGDTVAVVSENRVEWAEIMWGAARGGLDLAPLNFHLGSGELTAMLDACDARVVITSGACRGAVEEASASLPKLKCIWDLDDPDGYGLMIAARVDDDTLTGELLGGRVMFSSGTTGTPKAIRHRPQAPIHPRDAPPHLGEYTELFAIDDRTVYLSPAPTYHTAPFRFVYAVTQLGGTVVLMERFDASDALAAIERHRVTHAQFVPTMLLRMLRLPSAERDAIDVSSLRVAITGAAPCPPELKDRIDDWWGPVLHELYGASESYGNTHITAHEARVRRGSVGRAVRGRIHVTDPDGARLPPGREGLIWFEGGGQNGAPGLLRTVGDLGHVDDDGYLYLSGRANQIIVCGGVNIHPREVENVLMLHPAVTDVAVVGRPDPEYGEITVAYVVPADSARTAITDELIAHCRNTLAHYKCPRKVVIVPELPRGENGKMYARFIEELDARTRS